MTTFNLSYEDLIAFNWLDPIVDADLLTRFIGYSHSNNLITFNLSYEELPTFNWIFPNSVNNILLTRFTGSLHSTTNVYGIKLDINWDSFERSNEECAICRECDSTIILKCHKTHIFHQECLTNWFNISDIKKCPLCNELVF